ncbi:MAG: sulfatase-like hydrolase/transferase [Nannocystaceae bacterium]
MSPARSYPHRMASWLASRLVPKSLLGIFFLFSCLRLTHLCLFYFRDDPFGFPVVEQVERYLLFSTLVEIGAVAGVSSVAFFLFAFLGPARALGITGMLTSVYFCLCVCDTEVFRYFGQHINISFVQSYFKISNIFSDTVSRSLSSDPFALSYTLVLLATTLIYAIAYARRSVVNAPQMRTSRILRYALLALALILGSSPWWLHPFASRRRRIIPPLFVVAVEILRFPKQYFVPDDYDEGLRLLENYTAPPAAGWHIPFVDYPLYREPFFQTCQRDPDFSRCKADSDNDGFTQDVDCNDRDANIHPRARDVKSDGIDQNCSGWDAQPRNIIFVVLESFRGDFYRQLALNPTLAPNIFSLRDLGGYWFTNAHSPGFPSIEGAACMNLGILPHPDHQILTSHSATEFRAFAEYAPPIVNKLLVSAVDLSFDNQKSWLRSYYDSLHFDPTRAHDRGMFEIADNLLTSIEPTQPYLLTLITTSSHFPFKLEEEYRPSWAAQGIHARYKNSIHYFDFHFGIFLDGLKRRADWQRTVILILGDHGFPVSNQDLSQSLRFGPSHTWIGMGMFGPGLQLSTLETVSEVRSLLDIPPTLLDLWGVERGHAFMGRSLLHREGHAGKVVAFWRRTFAEYGTRSIVGDIDSESLFTLSPKGYFIDFSGSHGKKRAILTQFDTLMDSYAYLLFDKKVMPRVDAATTLDPR